MSSPPHSLVVFAIDERRFALDIAAVESVHRSVEISPLSESPPEVRGVINVHGVILPVFDLRAQMGFPQQEVRASEQLIIAHSSWRSVGETYFFRDPSAFEALSRQVIPELVRERSGDARHLRIWCAGCCSGEELYSLAIALRRGIPDIDDWQISILATDINPRFLQKAATGIYGQWSFRGVPEETRNAWFLKMPDGRFEVLPVIRKMVVFEYLNLVEDVYPAHVNHTNAMDLIVCRHQTSGNLRPTASRTGLEAQAARGSLPSLIVNDEDFLKHLREAFAIEAEEHVQAMTSGLLELEQAPAPERRKEVVETIFRDAHSLKGAARAVTRGEIESVCQALEGIFAQWKTSDVTAPPETFDQLNRAVDLLDTLLKQSGTDIDPEDRTKVTRIVHELAVVSSAAVSAPLPSPAKDQPAPSPAPAPAAPAPPEAELPMSTETVRIPIDENGPADAPRGRTHRGEAEHPSECIRVALAQRRPRHVAQGMDPRPRAHARRPHQANARHTLAGGQFSRMEPELAALLRIILARRHEH